MAEGSPEYQRSVAEARAWQLAHVDHYTGLFLRPHKYAIGDLCRRHQVHSILDYGCGKGQQYDWVDPKDDKTLEQYWGAPVAKFDPCWPPFERLPEGKFDLVLCTHVLGSIPRHDLGWVIDKLYAIATKAVFVAEKIGEARKTKLIFSRADLLPRFGQDDWKGVLERPVTREIMFAARERGAHGNLPAYWQRTHPAPWRLVPLPVRSGDQ